MPDGKEEREEQKQRLEQQKLQDLEDRLDQTDPDDWQPERPDSLALPPILPIRHPAMKPQNRIHPILRHKLPALPRILRLNPNIQRLHLSPQSILLQQIPQPRRIVILHSRKVRNQTHVILVTRRSAIQHKSQPFEALSYEPNQPVINPINPPKILALYL